MKTVIIGNEVTIVGLEESTIKDENNYIYNINSSILDGNESGDVLVDGVSYEWHITTYDNYDKLVTFLQKLGVSEDDLDNYVFTDKADELIQILKKRR